MKKLIIITAVLCAVSCVDSSLCPDDANAPVGWATCTSLEGGSYNLTGGGKGKSITITSKGGAFFESFRQDVIDNDVIILDGSEGEFVFPDSVTFVNVCNKTIVGINGATLVTKFNLDESLKDELNNNLNQHLSSSSGTGGYLSNGIYVDELRELKTRQFLIDYTGDSSESYRHAGFIKFVGESENVIIRNLAFIGPGSMDIGGTHLLELEDCPKHFWVDHCSFTDAGRTSMYIGAHADFIAVTWCTFAYTDKSYNHCYSNLVGGDDMPEWYGVDNLNVTYVGCGWLEGVQARTPMVRFGNVHVLNCYYAADGPNPRMDSEVRVENCYFSHDCKLVNTFAHAYSTPKAYQYVGNYSEDNLTVENKGEVNMPYEIDKMDASQVKEVVLTYAGPTLRNPLKLRR